MLMWFQVCLESKSSVPHPNQHSAGVWAPEMSAKLWLPAPAMSVRSPSAWTDSSSSVLTEWVRLFGSVLPKQTPPQSSDSKAWHASFRLFKIKFCNLVLKGSQQLRREMFIPKNKLVPFQCPPPHFNSVFDFYYIYLTFIIWLHKKSIILAFSFGTTPGFSVPPHMAPNQQILETPLTTLS